MVSLLGSLMTVDCKKCGMPCEVNLASSLLLDGPINYHCTNKIEGGGTCVCLYRVGLDQDGEPYAEPMSHEGIKDEKVHLFY
jgi:hypothetical protein